MTRKYFCHSLLKWKFCAIVLAAAFVAGFAARAATIWTGPLVTYNQPSPDPTQPANQDRITPSVWLTRAASGGLFNAVSETAATNTSPAGTEWAFGTLAHYATLPYTNWLAWLNGKSPTTMVGSNIVVHLISDDIYVSFKFSFWASKGSGGFTYQRSTAPIVNLSRAQVTGDGRFTFTYGTDPGFTYVVQSASSFPALWNSVETNVATNNTAVFSALFSPAPGPVVYRVLRLPSP